MHWLQLKAHLQRIKSVSNCLLDAFEYEQIGDFGSLPMLCHYSVKAQYMKNDPEYLGCGKKECQINEDDDFLVSTCSGSLTFHVVNIRANIEFVFFAGGFDTPCILKRPNALNFTNPKAPCMAISPALIRAEHHGSFSGEYLSSNAKFGLQSWSYRFMEGVGC